MGMVCDMLHDVVCHEIEPVRKRGVASNFLLAFNTAAPLGF